MQRRKAKIEINNRNHMEIREICYLLFDIFAKDNRDQKNYQPITHNDKQTEQ